MITKGLGKFITFSSALSLSPKNTEILTVGRHAHRKFRVLLPPARAPSLPLPPRASCTTEARRGGGGYLFFFAHEQAPPPRELDDSDPGAGKL